MPGTILVSVVEFMDLPLSSSTSIRVSMGKIEYQISDKGNFSFPLTSLRDDLIVKILDADGNEISRTGVHIRLVLEKGVLEDIFPLGAGHLHLKLQFILNDEERERIRIMRQSVLQKKHDELVSSRSGAESGSSTIIGNAALPARTNDEVSESPKEHLQNEAFSPFQSPVGFRNDEKSGARNVVGAHLDQKLLRPNIADQFKETSSSKPVTQPVILTQLPHKGKMPANESPSVKHPQSVTGSEEMAILLRSSEQIDAVTNNLIQPNLEEDSLQNSNKMTPPGRTPSNVRKMIRAFEGGLAQDMRSHIKPPPTKYQSSTTETEDSSKTQHLEQDKSCNTVPTGFLQERVKSSSLVRDLQKAPVYIGESREQINQLLNHVSPKDTMQLKELSTINVLNNQTDSNARNKSNLTHKKDIEEEKYYKDLMRTSTCETLEVSGKMPEKHSDRNHPCKLFGSKQDSRSNPKKEEKRMGNASEGSYELCIKGDSPPKLDSVEHFDSNYHSFESSGVWIFPDESRKICITTIGKRVMGLVESQDTKCISHQRSLDFSKLENMEKNAADIGSRNEGGKYEKIQESEKSKTKSSDDNGDENSGGPINQVIKVAIIIGFGILVLLTRQRQKR